MAIIHGLSQDKLQTGLKYHQFGMSDFCEKYTCSEKDIRDTVINLFSGNEKTANKVIKELKKNDKKQGKNGGGGKAKSLEPIVIKDENPLPWLNSEGFEDDFTTPLTEKELTVGELVKQRDEILETVNQKQDFVDKLLKGVEELLEEEQEQQHQLAELKRKLQTIVSRHTALEGKKQEYLQDISERLAEIGEFNSRIEDIDLKIKEKQKLILFAFSDCEITAEGKDISTLASAGVAEGEFLFAWISSDERCLDFRVREISMLVRLLVIAKNYPYRVEVEFENPEIEKVYLDYLPKFLSEKYEIDVK